MNLNNLNGEGGSIVRGGYSEARAPNSFFASGLETTRIIEPWPTPRSPTT